MIKKYWVIGSIMAVLLACVWLVYYFFFDYVHCTLSSDSRTLTFQGSTYVLSSLADQETTQVKRHAIGKTQNGDLVVELLYDPAHHELVVIPNTFMPPWLLFVKKQ